MAVELELGGLSRVETLEFLVYEIVKGRWAEFVPREFGGILQRQGGGLFPEQVTADPACKFIPKGQCCPALLVIPKLMPAPKKRQAVRSLK